MKLTAFIVLYVLNIVQCAKILGIFPFAAPSHYFLGNALLKELAEKGHDVTMISPFTEKNPPKNGSYRDLTLKGVYEAHEEKRKSMKMFDMEDKNLLFMISFMSNFTLEFTESVFKDGDVQNLLNSDEKFDAVIVEQFMNEAHKGFASHFKAPMILLSTIGANSWVNLLVGNPAPPAYVADALLGYSSQMTLKERLISSMWYLFAQCLSYLYTYPKQGELYRKYFPNGPDFNDVLYNASIVLLNSHQSTNQPVPYVPNMIDIGGFHIKPPKKLPNDLQTFLDSAKDGVIYFSMGSNLRSVELPIEKRNAFLKAFGKLKQKVLWKWEDDELPGQPQNVKLGKWLPQQDILAHPNVKVFITHGGLLSTTETIYHGVPVLAIPIAGDQKLNAQRIVNEGFGLQLSFKELSEESLTEKLDELLSNPRYKDMAASKSTIFHDRISKPMDTAIYWVEYVIRHRGASHLRVAAIDLPWYQYLLLDVAALVFAVIAISIYITSRLIKALLCSTSIKNKKKIKKN